jgi:hypothetical protein
VGDAVYGGERPASGVEVGPMPAARHMLHAAAAGLDDDVRAESPDPPDFAAQLSQLRDGA